MQRINNADIEAINTVLPAATTKTWMVNARNAITEMSVAFLNKRNLWRESRSSSSISLAKESRLTMPFSTGVIGGGSNEADTKTIYKNNMDNISLEPSVDVK